MKTAFELVRRARMELYAKKIAAAELTGDTKRAAELTEEYRQITKKMLDRKRESREKATVL